MNFKNEFFEYLKGERFSNSLRVEFDDTKAASYNRMEMLESLATGKSVLHVGFADHIPLIQKKMESGYWLHKRLLNKASFCVGVDIDKEAVDFVKNQFNIENIFCLNIIEENVPPYLCRAWDLMIIGEVLEHINNPVQFLQNIHEKYNSYVNQLILTVPNAFSLQNILGCIKNIELINSDHRFWFTPYTLAKVATEAGFKVDRFDMGQMYIEDKWWKRKIREKYPMSRENIIMQLNF